LGAHGPDLHPVRLPPEPAPLDPGCPVFDWSVHLHSSIYDEVFQVIPLPV
jgi:hypothetical protein